MTFNLISADDGSDQALQRMLGLSNDFDCFSTEDFKEGLGKLDDNMFRYNDFFVELNWILMPLIFPDYYQTMVQWTNLLIRPLKST